jgi:hypothetical protein
MCPVSDVDVIREALGFARSAIRSGEDYTEQASATISAGFEALDRLQPVEAIRAIEVAINRLAGVLMPPARTDEERYETWAHVELFGHRVLVGYVQEDEIAGRRVLGIRRLRRAKADRRVGEPDPPLELEEAWTCYSPHAVYSFQALPDEAAARRRWVALGGGSGSLHFASDDRDDDIPF